MLRNKPRVAGRVTRKQASPMADQPLFSSPKFWFFTSKITSLDSDFSLISPTSILDSNMSILSSKTKNPKPSSYFEPTIPDPRKFHPPDAFGLADLVKNRQDQSIKPVNKMVLFGSKLRVQIPSADLGTKTSHGQLSPCLKAKVLTVSEREDYTRVISHGPNPTITHIFDNSVFVETMKMDNFLSYCYTCNKNLDQNQDIYIYRGDKGFCSSDCRLHEMLLDHIES